MMKEFVEILSLTFLFSDNFMETLKINRFILNLNLQNI